MLFKKPINFNLHVFLKALLIMTADIVATVTAFFLCLWFRYDFSSHEKRMTHWEGFLAAIGP